MMSLTAIMNAYDGAEGVLSTFRAISEFRDNLLQKKLRVFLGELLSEDENFAEMALANLSRDVNDEYFSEALFNAVISSDSSYRARLLGIAVKLCAKGEIPANAFWSIQKVLSDLTVSDLQSISCLVNLYESKLKASESESFNVNSSSEALESAEYLENFPHDRILRLQSVGLVNVDSAGGTIERFSSKSMLYLIDKVVSTSKP